MLTISINHPDSPEFIRSKQDLTKVTGANISVKITNDFMQAVIEDKDYVLRFPCDWNGEITEEFKKSLPYNELVQVGTSSKNHVYYKKIKAKELWDELIHCAWNTAEPGIIFEDNHIDYSPDGVYEQFKGISTNPCFHPDTLIETIHGKKKISEIDKPTYVYSMDKDNKICIVPSTAAFKTKENAKTLKITLRNGSSITVTPDHKMYVHNIGWVEAKDLKVDMRIAHILRARRGKKYVGIKLTTQGNRDYIMEHRLVYESVFGKTENDIHHLDENTFNNLIDNLESIPHNEHSRKTAIEQNPQQHQERCNNSGKFISYSENKVIKGIEKLPPELATNFKGKWDNCISKIEEGECTDVYDIQVPNNHCLIANNMVAHNCGEIFMQAFDSCRLIHHNLTSYVVNPFTKEAYFDFELFYKNAYETMILADNLVDLEIEAIHKIIEHIKSSKDEDSYVELALWQNVLYQTESGRRCGVGFTGLSDTIAMLDMLLGNEKSLGVIDQIMKTKLRGELDATTDLAVLRGTFKGWDAEKEFSYNDSWNGNNEFYQFLFEEFPLQAGRMTALGRRNVSWNTVAPTGTVSILAGISSGIEPVFMPYYMRRKKCMKGTDRVDFIDDNGEKFTEYPVIHPVFKKWCETKIINTYTDNTTSTHRKPDLNNKQDLELLFAVSPWNGSTAPELNWEKRVEIQSIVQKYTTHSISSTINLPKETTKELVSNIYIESWKKKLKGITVYRDGCRDGILVNTSSTSAPKIENGRVAPSRPKDLKGVAYNTKIKGENHAVIIGFLNDKPYEVFIFTGTIKEGEGLIVKKKKKEYVFVPNDSEENVHITNLMNEEQAAMTRLISMSLRHGAKIEFIVDQLNKVDGVVTSFVKGISRILSKYKPKTEKVCSDCGGRVIQEGGCEKCIDCGGSKCMLIVK